MVDKLSQLGSAGAASDRPDKINKKVKTREAEAKASIKETDKMAAGKTSGAQVKISDSARELMKLRAEAERYLKMVEEKETLSAEELEEIQARLQSNHYLREEVIDKIIDKLLDLPGFKNL
ncbi:hypothetical protein [Caldithrix abyssi]